MAKLVPIHEALWDFYKQNKLVDLPWSTPQFLNQHFLNKNNPIITLLYPWSVS